MLEFITTVDAAEIVARGNGNLQPVSQMANPELMSRFSTEELAAIQWDEFDERIANAIEFDIVPDYDRLYDIYSAAMRATGMMPTLPHADRRPVILSLAGLTKILRHAAAPWTASTSTSAEGEFLTIVGPSGSGKVHARAACWRGWRRPRAGTILPARTRTSPRCPRTGGPTAMVFQSLALFDHKTVGREHRIRHEDEGRGPRSRGAPARWSCCGLVRLPESYYPRPVTQCSGGERQRVALARAFASDPEILFFDEPLSAIDYRLRKTLEVELKELHQRTGKTFVYITHSLEEAMVMSDRIAIMRAGHFVQIGTPSEIYRRARQAASSPASWAR